jgi:hypothetical protein
MRGRTCPKVRMDGSGSVEPIIHGGWGNPWGLYLVMGSSRSTRSLQHQAGHPAINGPDAAEWWAAVHRWEMRCRPTSIIIRHVWRPYGGWRRHRRKRHAVIPVKWVYDVKRGSKGEVLRRKARIVAKGFQQAG